MNKFIEVTKAIADESRVRILFMLNGHELCVCQIVEVLGLAPSTVSKHLSILRHAGLIEGRKEGRWIYYRISNRSSDIEAQKALAWVHESLARDSQTQKDLRKLKAVLKIDKEMLCNRIVQE
ncbi:MAG: metalloregulator ArsR/SmtB family transcription factor [Firmicutes bacterium]|nr:metalloregulator ArsR/SmtB family transcription factor [Bacillota bacterium]